MNKVSYSLAFNIDKYDTPHYHKMIKKSIKDFLMLAYRSPIGPLTVGECDYPFSVSIIACNQGKPWGVHFEVRFTSVCIQGSNPESLIVKGNVNGPSRETQWDCEGCVCGPNYN